MTLEVRCEGGVIFVLVSRSRKVVPDELVNFMSWDSRDLSIILVIVGWKDVVEDGVVDLSYLLNFFRVSLLGFSCFCLTRCQGGVHLVWNFKNISFCEFQIPKCHKMACISMEKMENFWGNLCHFSSLPPPHNHYLRSLGPINVVFNCIQYQICHIFARAWPQRLHRSGF